MSIKFICSATSLNMNKMQVHQNSRWLWDTPPPGKDHPCVKKTIPMGILEKTLPVWILKRPSLCEKDHSCVNLILKVALVKNFPQKTDSSVHSYFCEQSNFWYETYVEFRGFANVLFISTNTMHCLQWWTFFNTCLFSPLDSCLCRILGSGCCGKCPRTC